MNAIEHWENVYSTKDPNQRSWSSPHLDTSLKLIQRSAPDLSSPIIDVGGGASTLVDDLLALGYQKLTVLDISGTALAEARKRLGPASGRVTWIAGEVISTNLQPSAYSVWHDRAVFHFLTDSKDRNSYIRKVTESTRTAGHIILSTFGPEGPTRCSGLDVIRYDAEMLSREFGTDFQLLESSIEIHQTPWGSTQQFLYCRFQKL